jgi:hypothetical protein
MAEMSQLPKAFVVVFLFFIKDSDWLDFQLFSEKKRVNFLCALGWREELGGCVFRGEIRLFSPWIFPT